MSDFDRHAGSYDQALNRGLRLTGEGKTTMPADGSPGSAGAWRHAAWRSGQLLGLWMRRRSGLHSCTTELLSGAEVLGIDPSRSSIEEAQASVRASGAGGRVPASRLCRNSNRRETWIWSTAQRRFPPHSRPTAAAGPGGCSSRPCARAGFLTLGKQSPESGNAVGDVAHSLRPGREDAPAVAMPGDGAASRIPDPGRPLPFHLSRHCGVVAGLGAVARPSAAGGAVSGIGSKDVAAARAPLPFPQCEQTEEETGEDDLHPQRHGQSRRIRQPEQNLGVHGSEAMAGPGEESGQAAGKAEEEKAAPPTRLSGEGSSQSTAGGRRWPQPSATAAKTWAKAQNKADWTPMRMAAAARGGCRRRGQRGSPAGPKENAEKYGEAAARAASPG